MADTHEEERLLLSVDEAARRLSIGRSHLYEHLLRGSLRSIRIGRSRRIATRDLEAFVEALLQDSSDVPLGGDAELPIRPVKKRVPQLSRRR